MRSFPRIIFAVYLVLLLWLLLFKTSLDFVSVIMDYNTRSAILTPFTGDRLEIIENCIIFIPFGLLAGGAFYKLRFWQKLVSILGLSVVVEVVQYLFAIGVSDVTDIIMNTLGGLLGLCLYEFVLKHSDKEKLDRSISLTIGILIILALLLRFFVFRVRY